MQQSYSHTVWVDYKCVFGSISFIINKQEGHVLLSSVFWYMIKYSVAAPFFDTLFFYFINQP